MAPACSPAERTTAMQFGYFDDAAREYVITRPDTPRSWINYLGSRLYGGIISQNAGGYSFYKSGGTGRVLRMRFNGVPVDEPGRYLYLRDDASGDYWSAVSYTHLTLPTICS